MSKKAEIYQDITENCDILLTLLKAFKAENDTPEGRMIYQCRWLKEQVAANTLPLPVDEGMLSTLLYIYTNGDLCHLASVQEKFREEVEIFMKRLIKLAKKASLLLKPAYYPYAIRTVDALLNLLNNAPRALDQYEQGLIGELTMLKQLLAEGKIEPPLMSYMPDYSNFIEVEGIKRITIDDLPDGKYLYRTVANLFFEGIRPDTWLTPEDADRITQNLAAHYK